jgi:putative drug exporter of the RND superfamily
VAKLPHVAGVISPYAATSGGDAISSNGKIAFATVLFDEKANTVPQSAPERVVRAAKAAATPGLDVQLGGQAIEKTEQEGFGVSTGVGLMAAIVVLLLTFGSMVAMGLPILTALCGLGTGLGVIALFTHVIDMPNFSSELAAMIGLGVGIDYALFILTRFREAYRSDGPTHENVRESVVAAMDTAGRAVLFAGTTVVIALLGMMLLGVDFLYGVAISSSIGVLLMLFASLTLLPVLLTFAGARVARPRRRVRARERAAGVGAAGESGAWLRWSRIVQRRPWTIATLSALTMLLIAAPATALRLGSSDAANNPAKETSHKAYELLARGFGQGFNGPLVVAVRIPARERATPSQASAPGAGAGGATVQALASAGAAALAQLHAALARTPGVVAVPPAKVSSSGTVATLSVYPRSSPQAYATTQLVSRLRDSVIPPVAARTHVTVYVGGVTAGAVDFADVLAGKLPLFIGVVVLLSALLLMTVFRSLVIPLQAAAMNLLSIGAALGVIVAIFQWGWLGGLMGLSPGPIESFIPVMLFAIVFGLSMDYEVFLVSRIHERWAHTRESSRSVAEGLALTGRVVTAAGVIMVCVFLSFMVLEGRVIREFGLSLASAVFLDALVVRCLLLPAVLQLVGERTWWLPAWLARALPRFRIEGSLPVGRGAHGDQPQPALLPGVTARAMPDVVTEGADG